MISFAMTEEQEIARGAFEEFARKALTPMARAIDEEGSVDVALLEAAWSLGLVSGLAQAEADEIVQPTVLNALLLEELARGDATVATALAGPLGFVKAIVEQGSDRQKQALLPIYSGHTPAFAAIAYGEPGPKSGPAVRTVAAKTADGYSLRGEKALIPLADQCGHFLVVAECDGALDGFIVAAGTPGLAIRRHPGTLGLRALAMADVVLNDVEIPADCRLGENKATNLQRVIDSSRIALGAIMTGVARSVFEYTLPYTKDRVVHGEAIAKKQSVAFKLADMHIDIDAMHWMVLRAAAEADAAPQATRISRLAFKYCADRALWVADEGLQMFGGHGFTREFPLEMWYRNARSLSVLDGLIGA